MSDNTSSAVAVIDRIFALYDQHGHHEYGESVTMMMHMMQAALIAERSGFDDEMILAAFLHDIGHFFENEAQMGDFGALAHDKLGSAFLLECGFPERMAHLVASHVATKRYLTWSDSAYYDTLSDASKETLVYQGGPMNDEEAEAFRKDPLFEKYIYLRVWDDMGKETGVPVDPADIARMKEKALSYLTAHGTMSDQQPA
ncbi:MAG TPA: HDIG domain-containing protein [Chitinophaga sp.]|uniref:HD domain-containing protein n=1 Tax=Chitinophaga sp. TaxID=1869181 RepID=UPI002BD05D0C|nr:HDIG domain-containing metalloprotein [Chitinophaga sp.]HVI43799.1 HDIG domain-containing protein [Chitinophaga sp.]